MNGFPARTRQRPRLAAVNDHDAYIVASLMSFGIVKVANYVARPYLESGQLVQVLTDWTAEQLPISV
jgi:LysR family transcriptional regulator for bpeEF and oprC